MRWFKTYSFKPFDPYDRKPGLYTVKIFSKIAKYHGIKLSDLDKQLDSKTFDFLYKQLVKYQITTSTLQI